VSFPGHIAWWGHATALIQVDGVRLLTDPVITARAIHLIRVADPAPEPEPVDAVLISHLHRDHLHLRSLRRLAAARVIGPPGLRRVLGAADAGRVDELLPGEHAAVGPVVVTAVPADHDGRRTPWSRAGSPAIGFLIRGSRVVYFAGDTGPFAEMTEVGSHGLDAALVPIWGWGPSLGARHLDPRSAAEVLTVLRPRLAVPIHWGTYAPMWFWRRRPPAFVTRPVHDFMENAGRLAPEVRVEPLRPGGPGVILP
jgi:L-ascorbate metabolism protein UlaG (beta-lactamase superfamily)